MGPRLLAVMMVVGVAVGLPVHERRQLVHTARSSPQASQPSTSAPTSSLRVELLSGSPPAKKRNLQGHVQGQVDAVDHNIEQLVARVQSLSKLIGSRDDATSPRGHRSRPSSSGLFKPHKYHRRAQAGHGHIAYRDRALHDLEVDENQVMLFDKVELPSWDEAEDGVDVRQLEPVNDAKMTRSAPAPLASTSTSSLQAEHERNRAHRSAKRNRMKKRSAAVLSADPPHSVDSPTKEESTTSVVNAGDLEAQRKMNDLGAGEHERAPDPAGEADGHASDRPEVRTGVTLETIHPMSESDRGLTEAKGQVPMQEAATPGEGSSNFEPVRHDHDHQVAQAARKDDDHSSEADAGDGDVAPAETHDSTATMTIRELVAQASSQALRALRAPLATSKS